MDVAELVGIGLGLGRGQQFHPLGLCFEHGFQQSL
jgi:hypothetical protein